MGAEKQDFRRQTVEMFRRTDRLHKRLFEKLAVGRFGIHRTQHMMLMLISRKVNISQKEIATEFNISPAAVAVTIKKLDNAGLIVRNCSDSDCRTNSIKITEKGLGIVNQTNKLFSCIDYAMLDGIPEQDLAVFMKCLEKMQSNLINSGSSLPEREKE